MTIPQFDKSRGKQPFKPEAADAIRLATLRWYTVTMEQLLLQIYATDRKKYTEMEALLRLQVKQIRELARSEQMGDDDDGCPDGWKLCADGLCSPMCDFQED